MPFGAYTLLHYTVDNIYPEAIVWMQFHFLSCLAANKIPLENDITGQESAILYLLSPSRGII